MITYVYIIEPFELTLAYNTSEVIAGAYGRQAALDTVLSMHI